MSSQSSDDNNGIDPDVYEDDSISDDSDMNTDELIVDDGDDVTEETLAKVNPTFAKKKANLARVKKHTQEEGDKKPDTEGEVNSAEEVKKSGEGAHDEGAPGEGKPEGTPERNPDEGKPDEGAPGEGAPVAEDVTDNKNKKQVKDGGKNKKPVTDEEVDDDNDDGDADLTDTTSDSKSEDSSSEDDEDKSGSEESGDEHVSSNAARKRQELQTTLADFYKNSDNKLRYITGGSNIPVNRVKIIDAWPYVIRSTRK
jgi:hypothetical protein